MISPETDNVAPEAILTNPSLLMLSAVLELVPSILDIVRSVVVPLMVTVPNYNKPMQDGIFQHFSKISESTPLPIMMYNIPSRCGVNMTYETIVKLYHYSKNIVAIKEASGDLGQIQDIMNNCDIDIFAGDDSQLVPVMALGGKGVVSVYANINPTPVLNVFNSCLGNQFETARTEYFKYHNKIKELFVKTNPIPVKEMMAEQGMINKYLRLPLM